LAELDVSLPICEKQVTGNTQITEFWTELGHAHSNRGWARLHAGQPDVGAADLRRALQLWSKDPAPTIETRVEKARALALLAGQRADAKSGVTKDEAAAFATQAVKALRDAATAGLLRRVELKEPDFDAIRTREDFKKLLAEAKNSPVQPDKRP
jgi:hypothetical protein